MSDISIGTEDFTTNNANQNGGNIINDMFHSSNNKYANITQLIIDACTKCNINVVDYLLSSKFIPDLSITNKNGDNLLHCLIKSHTKESKLSLPAAIAIIKSGYAKSALNKQNLQGNTPLHLAAKYRMDYLVELMLNNGANKSVKNNKGFEVMSDTDMQSDTLKISQVIISETDYLPTKTTADDLMVTMKKPMKKPTKNSDLESILRAFKGETTDLDTDIGFMTQEMPDTKQLGQIRDLLQQTSKPSKSSMTSMPSIDESFSTDVFKDYVEKRATGNTMVGGSSNKIHKVRGRRTMKTLTEDMYSENALTGGDENEIESVEEQIDDTSSYTDTSVSDSDISERR